MRVLVIGGTGFLGSALCRRLVAGGQEVIAVARHQPPPGLLPPGVKVTLADASRLDDEELRTMMTGCDAVVHALGPDDRSPLARPAEAFLEQELVRLSERVVVAAGAAGVRRVVLLGSYFSVGGRTDAAFAAHHPYVGARIAQHDRSVRAAAQGVTVCTVEIPYVFGVNEGSRKVWEAGYRVVRNLPVAPRIDGGTAAATLDSVLDAIVAALERGRHGATYPVSDGHLTWTRWIELVSSELGRTPRFISWPRSLTRLAGAILGLTQRWQGQEAGLTPDRLADDIVHTHRRIDGDATRRELGLPDRSAELEPQIRATVRAVDQNR